MKSNFSRPRTSASTMAEPLQDVRPSLDLTFRGHRQSVLGVAMQPMPSGFPSTHSSSSSSAAHRHDAATAIVPPKTVSCGADGSVLLWDAKPTTRALRFVGHRGPVMGCAFSPKALVIASCGHDGFVRLWVPDLRRASSSFPAGRVLTQGVTGTSSSSSSSSFMNSEGQTGSVAFKAHSNGAARALAFATDGSDVLYTVGDDKGVKAWDLNYAASSSYSSASSASRFLGSFLGGHTNWVRCIAVQVPSQANSHTPYIATGGDDAAVLIWDSRSRCVAHRFSEHDGGVRSVAFHPAGYQVASGDANGTINVYDLRQASSSSSSAWPGRPSYGLIQHYRNAHGSTGSAVNALDFCPKGHWLLSAGDDAVVKLWDTLEGYLYCAMEAHDGPVRACQFATDGNFFSTGGADKVVMVWRSGLPGRCAPAVRASREEASTTRMPSVVDNEITHRGNGGGGGAPMLSTSLETVRMRLDRARYAPDEVARGTIKDVEDADDACDEANAHALPPPPPPPPTILSDRERSFERDEARFSHISGADASSLPTEDRFIDGKIPNLSTSQVKRVRFFGDVRDDEYLTPERSEVNEDKKGDSGVVPQEQPQQQQQQQQQQNQSQQDVRIGNLERAVAMLGEQVRSELISQRRETQLLRDEWEQSQVQHREELQKLMTMTAQLVQQQAVLIAQQQRGNDQS